MIKDSILCEGSLIEADEITNSIIGPRSVIKRRSIIRDSYLMGNDFYEPPVKNTERLPEKLFVGEDCIINRTILDKNIYIGNHVRLVNKENLSHYDGNGVYIRDGIIIVARGTHVPDGFCL